LILPGVRSKAHRRQAPGFRHEDGTMVSVRAFVEQDGGPLAELVPPSHPSIRLPL